MTFHCKILQFVAKDGDVVMESMKMEVKLTARSDGVVYMKCKEGDGVPRAGRCVIRFWGKQIFELEFSANRRSVPLWPDIPKLTPC